MKAFYKVHQTYFLIDIQYQIKLRKANRMSYFNQNEVQFYGPWPEIKEQMNTPTETSHYHQIFRLDEMLKRLRYLQKKCEYLEVQNEALRDEARENRKVHIKIEVFQKMPRSANIKSNMQVQPKESQQIKEKMFKRRRTEKQLIKNFRCPYNHCKKQYASSLALNLHIRNKHGGGTKRQRKCLLRNIIEAELKGEKLPEININLPPNYIEDKKQLLLFCEDLNQLSSKKLTQQ